MNILNYNFQRYTILISYVLFLISIYRNSWFPLADFSVTREVFLFFGLILVIPILLLNFKNLFDFRIFKNKIPILNILLFFFLSISILINIPNEFNSLYYIVRFFVFFSYLIVFIVLVPNIFVSDKNEFDKYFKFLFWFGTFVCLIGVIFVLINFVPYPKYTRLSKFLSISTHPNYISFLITGTVIIALYQFYKYKSENNNTFYTLLIFLSFILQFISQLLTLSRGGILGTAAGIFIFLILYYKKKFVYFIPFIIIVAIYFIFEIFIVKGIGSSIARILLLVPVYKMIMNFDINTFFGFGTTYAFDAYKILRLENNVVEAVNNPHNSILSLLLMYGLFFVIIFLLIYLKCIYKNSIAILKKKSFGKFSNLDIIMLISLNVALFVNGIFESALVMPEYYTLIMFLISFGFLLRIKPTNSEA